MPQCRSETAFTGQLGRRCVGSFHAENMVSTLMRSYHPAAFVTDSNMMQTSLLQPHREHRASAPMLVLSVAIL